MNDEALRYLKHRGVQEAMARTAQLRLGEGTMAGRVVFDWFTQDGEVVFSTGRAMNGQAPKYLHTPGIRPPLYAGPGAWEARRVVVVEGQVDALACAQAGVSAFAVSGSSLPDAAVEILAGKDEVLLAFDNDDAGRRMTEQAIDRLAGLVDLSVVVIPEDSKDLAEIAESADDPAEAVAEVLATAEPVVEQDIDDLLHGEDDADYDWLVDGGLERTDRMLLTGREGAGKSLLLQQICTQAAHACHPFGGDDLEAVRTVLVDLENSENELRRRLRPLRLKAGDRLERRMLFVYSRPEGLDLTGDEEDRQWLRERLRRTKAELLCIGPLYKMAGGNPNDEEDSKALATFLDELRAEFGVAVIIEAHMTHEGGGRPFGWSGWRRWPEIGLELKESGELLHWRTPRHPTPGIPPALKRGGEWPFTPATRPREVLWARIVETYQVRPTRPSLRDMGTTFSLSHSTIRRTLEEHVSEWEAMFSE